MASSDICSYRSANASHTSATRPASCSCAGVAGKDSCLCHILCTFSHCQTKSTIHRRTCDPRAWKILHLVWTLIVVGILSPKVLAQSSPFRCQVPGELPEINETSPAGTVLLTVGADDDMEWRYELPALPELQEYLTFTRNSAMDVYVLALAKPLDAEEIFQKGIQYVGITQITLFCQEPGRTETKSTVYLQANDINEFSPKFNTSTIEIFVKENPPENTRILTLSEWASDRDNNYITREIASYSLIPIGSNSQTENLFELSNSYEGIITVTDTLDFDTLPANRRRLFFGLRVNDTRGLSGTANLTVTIEDEDDLPPVFFYDGCSNPCNIVYRASFNLNFTGEVDTLEPSSIQARDGDTLGYSITYHLIQGPEDFENYVSLDASTARLTVIRQMQDFPTSDLAFVVEAREVSTLGRSSRASLLISLGGALGVASASTSTDDSILAAAIVLGILFFIVVVCLVVGMVLFRKKYRKPVHPEGSYPIRNDESPMAEDSPRGRLQGAPPISSMDNKQLKKNEIKENGVVRKKSMKVEEEMLTWMPIAANNDIVDLSDEDTIKRIKKIGKAPADTTLPSVEGNNKRSSSKDPAPTSPGGGGAAPQEDYPETEYAEVDTPPPTRKECGQRLANDPVASDSPNDLPVVKMNQMYGVHSTSNSHDYFEMKKPPTSPQLQQTKSGDVDDAEYATPRETEAAASVDNIIKSNSVNLASANDNNNNNNGKRVKDGENNLTGGYINRAFKKDEPHRKPPRRPGSKKPGKKGDTRDSPGKSSDTIRGVDDESLTPTGNSESQNSSVAEDVESQSFHNSDGSVTGSGILYSTETDNSPRLPPRRQWMSSTKKKRNEDKDEEEHEVTEYSVPTSNRSSCVIRPPPLSENTDETKRTSISLNKTGEASKDDVVPLRTRQNRPSPPPKPLVKTQQSGAGKSESNVVSAFQREEETEDPYATIDKLKKSPASSSGVSADQHDDADESGEGECSSANEAPASKSANGSFPLQAPSRRKRPRKRTKFPRAPEEDVYDGTKDYEDLEVDSGFYTDTSKTKIKRSSRLPLMKPDPNDTRYWITVTNDY